MTNIYKTIILGSGPAGLTAALYTARAELKPLVIDGSQPGGQLTTTTDVENYPGFPDGIMGPELMDNMRKQAERFGTTFLNGEVTKVDLSKRPFTLTVSGKDIQGETLIIATGASAKYLGLKNEQRLIGKGVSACATCDGFFFKDKEVVVVGGGDAAMEESSFLTKFATKVTLVHRKNTFRASKIMQERVKKNPKIEIMYETEVVDVLGEEKVAGVMLKNVKTGETHEFATDGLFLAIGHKPNTEIFKGQIDLGKKGYIKLKEPGRSLTNVEGVFAGGDVHDHLYRQAVTAAGFGSQAAIDAERFLAEQEG